jgi:hypothetical protein
VQAFGVADVVHTADVRVDDDAGEANFSSHPLEPIATAGHRRGHQLQRDDLSEPEIVRTIHLTHRPAAEQADNAVARGKDAPRRKSRIVQRIERKARR